MDIAIGVPGISGTYSMIFHLLTMPANINIFFLTGALCYHCINVACCLHWHYKIADFLEIIVEYYGWKTPPAFLH